MSTLVVGLGSEDRGDDGVGALVVRHLRGTDGLVLLCWPGDPLSLLGTDAWRAADRVILVDAELATPGAVRMVATRDLRGEARQVSSHGLGAAGLVELVGIIEPEGPPVVAVTIGGTQFTLGTGVSPGVRQAVPGAAALVRSLAKGAAHVPG